MDKKDLLLRSLVIFVFVSIFIGTLAFVIKNPSPTNQLSIEKSDTQSTQIHPLSIEVMRKRDYPGSNFVIEETLGRGSNYNQYIASYESEGLKIYGLLTVPTEEKPEGGFPAIIFNHGYIPPEEYKTTERYVSYVDGFASRGFVVFKPDYRGHGNSDGEPTGTYFSPGYTVDVLNALSSVKKLQYVNPNKIGMWGHSLGGNIAQRVLVVDPKDIKASVIWGGVVGSYKDMLDEWWNKRSSFSPWQPSSREQNANRPSRQKFIQQNGEPTEDSKFWNSISPASYIGDISGPIQLHHGLSDETVPYSLSQKFYDKLISQGKTAELYFYEATDHNLSQSFDLAIKRSVEFFDKYLK
jgi:uncharacterized protein